MRPKSDERRRRSAAAVLPLEQLGQFAGALAHEFNNLLAGVLGNLSLVRDDLPSGSELRDAVDDAAAAATEAAALCRQLLLSTGRDRPAPRPVDLHDVLRDLLSDLATTPRLELRLSDDLPPVLADPLHLRRALTELIDNAAKAAGAAGQVRILAEAVTADAAQLAGALPDATALSGLAVRIQVVDDGPGLAAEVLARCWLPFYTTDATRRGLGLPTVLGIVAAHGGAVRLETAPGEGCRVDLWWPVAEEQESVAAPLTVPTGLRVLLADDADLVRSMSDRMLRMMGCTVVQAWDGQEALARFEQDPEAFDVVLLDVAMPGLDGPTVLARMLNLRPELPAVLMSGYTERDVEAECPCEFLAKPFSRQALTAAVARALLT